MARATSKARVADVAGACDDRDQGMVAAHVVVGEPRATLLLEPVGLTDRGVDIDGEWLVARPCARGPRSFEQLARNHIELAGVTEREASQKGSEGGRRHHPMTEHLVGLADTPG